jgi:hypothetical protein
VNRTYGDYYFTAWGLILTLLGTFLAALKTVVTNLIQTGAGGRLKLVNLPGLVHRLRIRLDTTRLQCITDQ